MESPRVPGCRAAAGRGPDNRLGMHDVADFLKDHAPFSDLDAAALDRLAAGVEMEHFTAGTTIFEQGARAQDKVRVIRRGAVALVDHGRVLDVLGEGEMFGHPSMVSGLPTGSEARAHEDSLCYAIPADDVRPLLAGPSGLRYLARSLLSRSRSSASRASHCVTPPLGWPRLARAPCS